ncbi:glycosyltransferase family 4 protein [Methanobacterium sp. ACI-7]|uniref:glycosyltransferase family 4 protein n=1 Tax=unclassified Methanobacterium TaxID=2627676 RepID=UPI0039C1B34D
MKNEKRICFLAPTAYSLLKNKKENIKNVIGPDIDQIVLARELSKKGYKITIITHDEGGPSEESINHIKVVKIYPADSKISILSKMLNLWNAFKKSDSDIYFHYGDSSGILSIFAYLTGKRSIYKIASDVLLDKNLIINEIKEFKSSKFNSRVIGNWIDIKLSNAICLQNQYQSKMLKKRYNKNGKIIKSHIEMKDIELNKKSDNPLILWVGSMAEVKQPWLFIELAKMMPSIKFQMIGGYQGDPSLYNDVKRQAEELENFEFLGVVPFEDINYFFSKAWVLINTSMFEGFPNSFLQAWTNYMPVLSINSNPDEVITKYKLGYYSRNLEQLKEDLSILLNDDDLIKEMGINGRKYVENNHDINNILPEYIELFNLI